MKSTLFVSFDRVRRAFCTSILEAQTNEGGGLPLILDARNVWCP